MKPCSNNRKQLALLAVDAIHPTEQRALRAHIQACDGCRAYLQEISNVTQKLATVELRSEIQTSETFHQRVVRSLKAHETASMWSLLAQLRGTLLNWRVALPLVGATALLIAAFFVFGRPSTVPAPNIAQTSPPNVKAELDPSISNYQMVANRSLDKLDELLKRQATRNPSPGPIYTASMLAARGGLD